MIFYTHKIIDPFKYLNHRSFKRVEKILVYETETENNIEGHQRRPSRKWVSR